MSAEQRDKGPASSRVLWLCAALASCGGLAAQVPDGADFAIVVDEAALAGAGSEVRTAAWIGYATAIVAKASSPEFSDRPIDDFTIEAFARTKLAEIWSEARPPGSPDPYLDKLVEIHAAGFVDEYVLATFAQPGWTISAAELDALEIEEFYDWAPANLARFSSVTAAKLEPKTRRQPAPTGGGLPDPAAFEPPQVACSSSLPSIRSALAQWESEAAVLRGAPLAAETRRQFIGTLLEVAERPPYSTDGVAWVSPRAALLHFYAGFCAVEVGDLESAVGWLGTARTMLPFAYDVRQELIHVLVGQGELDDADAEVEDILQAADEPCTLARAWRRRGYIRFEQQRWDEARAAYLRSLEYDPGSELALDELELIRQQLEPGAEASPGLPPQTLLTRCQQ